MVVYPSSSNPTTCRQLISAHPHDHSVISVFLATHATFFCEQVRPKGFILFERLAPFAYVVVDCRGTATLNQQHDIWRELGLLKTRDAGNVEAFFLILSDQLAPRGFDDAWNLCLFGFPGLLPTHTRMQICDCTDKFSLGNQKITQWGLSLTLYADYLYWAASIMSVDLKVWSEFMDNGQWTNQGNGIMGINNSTRL